MIIINVDISYTCGLFISKIIWIDNENDNSEDISNEKDNDDGNDKLE